MDLRTVLIIVSCLVTFASLGYFGIKFLQKKNYLLGIEWLILSASSGNFAVYWITSSEAQYQIAVFFDAFSKDDKYFDKYLVYLLTLMVK